MKETVQQISKTRCSVSIGMHKQAQGTGSIGKLTITSNGIDSKTKTLAIFWWNFKLLKLSHWIMLQIEEVGNDMTHEKAVPLHTCYCTRDRCDMAQEDGVL